MEGNVLGDEDDEDGSLPNDDSGSDTPLNFLLEALDNDSDTLVNFFEI